MCIRQRGWAWILILGGPVVWTATAQARYEAVDWADVPIKVREAAQAGAPGVRFSQAAREAVGAGKPTGAVRYKLTGRDERGRMVAVHVGSDNRLYGVDRTIALSDISKPAAAALRARRKELPRGFKLVRVVERSNYGSPIAFVFEGKNPKGARVHVTISPDGKHLNVAPADD